MKTYFFVDTDGTENVSNVLPTKNPNGFWTVETIVYNARGKPIVYDAITELPRGTIKALFDKELTFNDPPILVE